MNSVLVFAKTHFDVLILFFDELKIIWVFLELRMGALLNVLSISDLEDSDLSPASSAQTNSCKCFQKEL
jgi:hypothetical protein